jgi:peptidoglycan hydrolase-like protein with peptidoglycan-binding domain
MDTILSHDIPGARVPYRIPEVRKVTLDASIHFCVISFLYFLCSFQLVHAAGLFDEMKSYGKSIYEDVVNSTKKEADKEVRETVDQSVNDAKQKTREAISGETRHDRKLVADIQAELNRLGYNAGVVDGIYGSGTSRAIQRFQRDQKMVADGIPTQSLLESLESQAVGKKGSTGYTASSSRPVNAKHTVQGTSTGKAGGRVEWL